MLFLVLLKVNETASLLDGEEDRKFEIKAPCGRVKNFQPTLSGV